MTNFIKKFFLLIFCVSFSLKADAEDFLRLRYLLPYSSEVEIDRNSSQSKVKLETAGNSCNFIFVNGIGLGYNSL